MGRQGKPLSLPNRPRARNLPRRGSLRPGLASRPGRRQGGWIGKRGAEANASRREVKAEVAECERRTEGLQRAMASSDSHVLAGELPPKICLAALCEELSRFAALHPGTSLRLVHEIVSSSAAESAPRRPGRSIRLLWHREVGDVTAHAATPALTWPGAVGQVHGPRLTDLNCRRGPRGHDAWWLGLLRAGTVLHGQLHGASLQAELMDPEQSPSWPCKR